MTITNAQSSQAAEIAPMIMEAMNLDCCQYYAGEYHTLHDFERLMTALVVRNDSQYSYRNTLVALDEAHQVAGICVAYDGKDLLRLRRAFIDGAKEAFGRDFSGMDEETQTGEFYVDSLCVKPEHRGKGIATGLLHATIERARERGIAAVGLLVDKGNPLAERLYTRLGFVYKNDTKWGGHEMKHLVYELRVGKQ